MQNQAHYWMSQSVQLQRHAPYKMRKLVRQLMFLNYTKPISLSNDYSYFTWMSAVRTSFVMVSTKHPNMYKSLPSKCTQMECNLTISHPMCMWFVRKMNWNRSAKRWIRTWPLWVCIWKWWSTQLNTAAVCQWNG